MAARTVTGDVGGVSSRLSHTPSVWFVPYWALVGAGKKGEDVKERDTHKLETNACRNQPPCSILTGIVQNETLLKRGDVINGVVDRSSSHLPRR